ncbi:sulfotransferase family protein [Cochlodiniinecator piscidefendens]|uniref:sulfotransferase family protein n=1 Tax=Cochlodiniinecator piscidefendens TaxID=2715756 RepID=UPI00140AC3CD|nr:sulfotransferase [Cochlodiniinecator piscidefendens]
MPYFMIGTQRSGSNLLRIMINQSPELVAPHPPHILERLGPLLPEYGNLENPHAFAQLVDDVCTLVDTNPVSWHLGTIDREKLAAKCSERSLVAINFEIHNLLAAQNGARSWVCKSLANVHYADEIDRFGGEQAKFIHLHRDGRDVALSFRKAIVGEKTAFHIAKQWRDEQEKALALAAKLPANRVISVSYSNLVTDPRNELTKLCDFMDVPFQEEMLEFQKSREATDTSKAGKMWSNVQKPIMSENVKKFMGEMNRKDIAIFEAVAGETLTKLGYPLVSGFDEENARLKKYALEQADPADLEKRKAQAGAMNEIKTRLMSRQSNVA